MTTISRRATRKIAAIKAAVTRTVVYRLDNDFVPAEVPAQAAWDALATFTFARLLDREDGTYQVSVHGNLWYVLHTEAPDPSKAGAVGETASADAVWPVHTNDIGEPCPFSGQPIPPDAVRCPDNHQWSEIGRPVEHVHEVAFTNSGCAPAVVEIPWGCDRRIVALEEAASIRAGGGTVHGIVALTPDGPVQVQEDPAELDNANPYRPAWNETVNAEMPWVLVNTRVWGDERLVRDESGEVRRFLTYRDAHEHRVELVRVHATATQPGSNRPRGTTVSNTSTAPAAATQTEVDIRNLMNTITSELAHNGQQLPSAGLIRLRSALITVFSARDDETSKLRARLDRVEAAYSIAENRLDKADLKCNGLMHHDVQDLVEEMRDALHGE